MKCYMNHIIAETNTVRGIKMSHFYVTEYIPLKSYPRESKYFTIQLFIPKSMKIFWKKLIELVLKFRWAGFCFVLFFLFYDI